MAKLIVGCGYLGSRVAALWRAQGHTVYAVTRQAKKASDLQAAGLSPLVADIVDRSELVFPQDVETVLFSVGYDRESGKSIHDVYVGGLERVIACLPSGVGRIIYISTTGVYGLVSGREVDEASECRPTRPGGKASLAAEDVLRASRWSSRAIILRLAGIYGPGRIPRAADLLAGRPIDAPATGWLNLIHVEDAARIVLLAEQRAPLPSLYVVSDKQPVIRGDYYRELARLVGAKSPQFVEPDPSSAAAQRAAGDKRVNPRKLQDELQPVLVYPSYREGLAQAVQTQRP